MAPLAAVRPVCFTEYFRMLASLTPAVQAAILDMDGVLWKDKQPLINLKEAFERFDSLGIRVVLATNNSSRTVKEYQEKIAAMGAQVAEEQIVTSSMAAAHVLHQRFPQGGPVYILGAASLHQALEQADFFHAEENVLAVISGLDRTFSFDKLARATRLIRQGAFFMGTNPDTTFPTPNGLGPGAGSILAAIQTASEQTAVIAGKPSPTLYQMAMQRLGVSPQQTVSIGDRMETDILGGIRAGCRTALVLSGVTSRQTLQACDYQPDLVAEDLIHLLSA